MPNTDRNEQKLISRSFHIFIHSFTQFTHSLISNFLDLPNTDKNEQKVDITTTQTNLTDPYVDIRLDKESIWRTPIAMDTLNPTWNENYRFDICHIVKLVTFVVVDKDKLGLEKIGSVSFFAIFYSQTSLVPHSPA